MWIVLMECRSFQVLGESTLPLNDGCGHQFIVRLTLTAKACFCPECKMKILIDHQYGTILKLLDLQESRNSPKRLTSSSAGSRDCAKTSVLQELEKAWQESEADYFSRSCAWPKKSSPNSYSLKTSQPSQQEGDFKSLDRLPKWGMIVDGVLYPLHPLEHYTKEKGGFFWPTPRASDYKRQDSPCERRRQSPSLTTKMNMFYGKKNQRINLRWIEWLMGYPSEHTQLKPWVMQWYRLKLKKRLKS